MTERKFYKTIIQVEILSEEALPSGLSLTDIDFIISEGDCSGQLQTISEEVLDGKQAAQALLKQGSDPDFFMLTEEGDCSEHF